MGGRVAPCTDPAHTPDTPEEYKLSSTTEGGFRLAGLAVVEEGAETMRSRFVGLVLAGVVMFVGLVPTAAHAEKPLDVDCDVLAATLVAVDAFLEALPVSPIKADSLGELLATFNGDPGLFAAFNGLIVAFSGGTISFDSRSQMLSTIGKCGLVPLLNELVTD